MLKDGLYELFYRAANAPDSAYETMLMVLRDGRILAADPWGGVCMGQCLRDPKSHTYHLKVRLLVPPGGMLVTDDAPRLDGAEVEIGAEFDDPSDGVNVIDIDGRLVSVALKYQGPISL